jgi:hypothetical protein
LHRRVIYIVVIVGLGTVAIYMRLRLAIAFASGWTIRQGFMGWRATVQKFHHQRLETLYALLGLLRLTRLVPRDRASGWIHAGVSLATLDAVVARPRPVTFQP